MLDFFVKYLAVEFETAHKAGGGGRAGAGGSSRKGGPSTATKGRSARKGTAGGGGPAIQLKNVPFTNSLARKGNPPNAPMARGGVARRGRGSRPGMSKAPRDMSRIRKNAFGAMRGKIMENALRKGGTLNFKNTRSKNAPRKTKVSSQTREGRIYSNKLRPETKRAIDKFDNAQIKRQIDAMTNNAAMLKERIRRSPGGKNNPDVKREIEGQKRVNSYAETKYLRSLARKRGLIKSPKPLKPYVTIEEGLKRSAAAGKAYRKSPAGKAAEAKSAAKREALRKLRWG